MDLDEMDILLYDIRRLKTFLKMLDKQAVVNALSRIGGTPLEATESSDGNVLFISVINESLTKLCDQMKAESTCRKNMNAIPLNAIPPCEMWREAEDEHDLDVKTIVLWVLVEFIWGVCVGAFLMFLIRR